MPHTEASCFCQTCARPFTAHIGLVYSNTSPSMRPLCSLEVKKALALFSARMLCEPSCVRAIIFADVSSAYYCTLRELASRLASSDMRPNDVSGASDALCLEYQLREPPALAQQGAHPWLQALTEALNQGTWMHLKGDSVPIATRRGTRPGSAWADLTFGVLSYWSGAYYVSETSVEGQTRCKAKSRMCRGIPGVIGGRLKALARLFSLMT